MKKILVMSLCLIGFVFCGEKTADFDVKGMMCSGGCVKKINKASLESFHLFLIDSSCTSKQSRRDKIRV